jgi:F0F1-type ATP synthase delta subunit
MATGRTTDERVEDLAAAITGQNRTLAFMLSNQRLHNEMLAKVLEAVTKEGDDRLGNLLAQLVKESGEHGEVLELIAQRVLTE